jgi:hypothetical protein
MSLSSASSNGRVGNEHIDNRAALLDEQKRRPKSHVGAADPATCGDSRWRDESALMINSADRLLPTASRPDTGETPAHGKHSLKKRHGPVRYSNFVGQGQGLLNPDVTLLDLGRFHTARIAANEPLRESMSARTRTGYALKTLLSDRETAQQACELRIPSGALSSAVLSVIVCRRHIWNLHHASGGKSTG